MIKMNKKVEYALMALKYLAESDKLVTARELSDGLKTPFDTVSKVLQTLGQHKIVESLQGVHGGYRLIQPLDKISYGLLEATLEGELALVECLKTGTCKQIEACNILTPVQRLDRKIKDFLNQVTLSELLLSDTQTTSDEIKESTL